MVNISAVPKCDSVRNSWFRYLFLAIYALRWKIECLFEQFKSHGFELEFPFRDAKQFTGLLPCKSRQHQSLEFHR